ncbi:MAG: MarR family transcriptional regulator, organic hydroperoxide resistance regulator [Alphaproteobacteria bacterium]|jgi:DNA-binding MarR family transcriptional regulator|nr:MarR family transcriptional regulator, organic hydroperoxide resistance regulator [Alphaproteobacteria bacterium]
MRANELPPEDATLREFMADFHAAMSVMRLLRQEIAATLSLSSAEYSVLLAVWYLERGGQMTVRAIADHMHVAAAHVTSEVGKLVERGLLTKKPDRTDRRAVGVGLTDASRDVFRRLAPMLREINARLFAGFYYSDLATVHRFLVGIIEHGRGAIAVAESHKATAGPQSRNRASRSQRRQ